MWNQGKLMNVMFKYFVGCFPAYWSGYHRIAKTVQYQVSLQIYLHTINLLR